jgi:lipopolysaccharide export system ATP-binding protein
MSDNGTTVPALRADHLVKSYGRRIVVNDVSIELKPGRIVGLLGPNGAGKTTTFYMITGFIPPNRGRVCLGEKDVTRLPMYRRARSGIGYLSQEPSIFQNLTVEQNLKAILQTQKLNRKARKERLEFLLEELGITHLAKHKAHTLSGGERRRVEIARTLVTKPRFMLLDEPFVGIDPIAVEEIQRIVTGLRDKGIGILITDHNVHETLSITDHAYLLYEGRVLTNGSSTFLANDPETRRLYLGEKFKLGR